MRQAIEHVTDMLFNNGDNLSPSDYVQTEHMLKQALMITALSCAVLLQTLVIMYLLTGAPRG